MPDLQAEDITLFFSSGALPLHGQDPQVLMLQVMEGVGQVLVIRVIEEVTISPPQDTFASLFTNMKEEWLRWGRTSWPTPPVTPHCRCNMTT